MFVVWWDYDGWRNKEKLGPQRLSITIRLSVIDSTIYPSSMNQLSELS